ncbi:hypothetical protein Tco_0227074 [Tanacetum coccineum]
MVVSPPSSSFEGSLLCVVLDFVYAEDEEDLSFLPKETSSAFGTSSPSVSVNIEPLMTDEEPVLQPAEAMADSRGSPKHELGKIALGSSTACATRAKIYASKDDVSFLTISDEDEGLSDVPELKDATAYLHDRCYARQAFFENVVNRRSRELLEVIEKLRDEQNVIALREKISTLSTEAKEHKANLDRMMLESQKWAGYQDSLSSLESQVVSLEAEKAQLEAVEVSLRKKVDDVRRDRMEVVSKVVPMTMKLIYSDDLGSLVGKLVTSAIVYGRCKAFEQVAAM